MIKVKQIGQEAKRKKGWWLSNRFLLLRRFSQLSILGLFLVGPWFGVWILKGNLSSSVFLDVVPFTDPFILMQSLTAGHIAGIDAFIGALVVLVCYLLVGGRVFCSWVCPINIVTDSAAWLRRQLKIRKERVLARTWRYWILAMVMILPMITGTLVWELVNPVSAFHRGLFFGMGMAWIVFIAIFLFDLLAVEHGWCGHFCPMGAFYGLLNRFALFKVDAINRTQCTDCLDCFNVCPESAILKGPIHGQKKNIDTLVSDMNCTNCGRCIDVCAEDVFVITTVLTRQKSLAKVGN